MVKLTFEPIFRETINKLNDSSIKEKIKKQIQKIADNPEIGKPMRHNRKGTREVYVKPYRLSYSYSQEQDEIIFLEFYHKDKQ